MRQLAKSKRRLCVGSFVLVAAPVLLASVASACTQLANLQANPNSGAAGSTITVTGSRFRTAASDSPSEVQIRLNSRSATPIATLPVASINPVGGTISMQVTIPAGTALGYHTLIATQHNTTTTALLSGFPVRATYNVTSAATPKESTGVPAMAATGAEPATTAAAADGSTPAAGAGSISQAPADAGGPAAPAGSGAVAATVATPAARTAQAGPGAPGSSPATAVPVSPVALSSASGQPQAATTIETAALSTSSEAAASTPAQTISSGLIASASDGSASVLPELTLAIGAAVVLLSLMAFLKSGRTLLAGRRPTNLV